MFVDALFSSQVPECHMAMDLVINGDSYSSVRTPVQRWLDEVAGAVGGYAVQLPRCQQTQ